jgi:glycosidase
MRDAMVDAMSYWVEEFDIDGFRCDVAGAVSTGFWNDAREALNQLKPLFMLAEDSSNSLLLQSAFSANYGWKLQDQMRGLAVGDKRTFFFKTFYAWEKTKYPTGTFPMTFITNHDENSWNGTEYERYGKFVKSFSALYFTYTGIPLIYSGQEIGLKRRLAFFDKDEIIDLKAISPPL